MTPASIYTKFFLVLFANGLLFFTLPDPLILAVEWYFCSFQVLAGRFSKGMEWLAVCTFFTGGTLLASHLPDNPVGDYLLFILVGLGKLLPIIVVGAFIAGTSKVSEIIYALRRLHMPQWVVIPVSVLFRFFPTIRQDYHQIRKAMKFRGIAVTTADMFRRPLRTMEYIYVPLLSNAANVAGDLTAAALTRAITDPGPKTSLVSVRFTPVDAIMCIMGLLLIGCGLHVAV